MTSLPGESVLERVVRVLEAFAGEREGLGVTDVASRAHLPTSTAHRLMAEMTERGLLERADRGRYRVGTWLWEISHRTSPAISVRQVALPYMESLHLVVRQHVQLGVRSGHEVLYLEQLSHSGAVGNIAATASRLPLTAASAGLVMLAFAPRALVDEVTARPLPRLTDESIAEARQLQRFLAGVRRRGYAVGVGLARRGSKGIAVPIWGVDAEPAAVLSIVLPSQTDHRPLVPAVRTTAHMISVSLVSRAQMAVGSLSPDPVEREEDERDRGSS